MQIREQGRQVQLIRSPYDKEKKRCVQKVVHAFKQQPYYSAQDLTRYLSAEQLADLSDDEKRTLGVWLQNKIDARAAAGRETAVSIVSTYASRAAEAISSGRVPVTTEQAAEMWEAMGQLAKALKKADRPRRAAKVIS